MLGTAGAPEYVCCRVATMLLLLLVVVMLLSRAAAKLGLYTAGVPGGAGVQWPPGCSAMFLSSTCVSCRQKCLFATAVLV
jgi:hypothetical protein